MVLLSLHGAGAMQGWALAVRAAGEGAAEGAAAPLSYPILPSYPFSASISAWPSRTAESILVALGLLYSSANAVCPALRCELNASHFCIFGC